MIAPVELTSAVRSSAVTSASWSAVTVLTPDVPSWRSTTDVRCEIGDVFLERPPGP
jgi:hypothetical protein